MTMPVEIPEEGAPVTFPETFDPHPITNPEGVPAMQAGFKSSARTKHSAVLLGLHGFLEVFISQWVVSILRRVWATSDTEAKLLDSHRSIRTNCENLAPTRNVRMNRSAVNLPLVGNNPSKLTSGPTWRWILVLPPGLIPIINARSVMLPGIILIDVKPGIAIRTPSRV